MRGKRVKIVHRTALALALLGAFLHVGALAWHPFARSWSVRADQQLLSDLETAICHGTGGASPAELPGSTPPTPDRQGECLLCQGLAGACIAIRVTADSVLLAPVASTPIHWASTAAMVAAWAMAPRSRGPPGSIAS